MTLREPATGPSKDKPKDRHLGKIPKAIVNAVSVLPLRTSVSLHTADIWWPLGSSKSQRSGISNIFARALLCICVFACLGGCMCTRTACTQRPEVI